MKYAGQEAQATGSAGQDGRVEAMLEAMKQIGSVFPAVVREIAQNEEVALVFLEEFWCQIVGAQVAERCRPYRLSRKKLVCLVSRQSWIQHLQAMQPLIVRSVNRYWNVRLVERIEFRFRLIENGD